MYDLTVVVADAAGEPGVQACVDSIHAGCRGLTCEVVVASSVQPRLAATPEVRWIAGRPGDLVPQLWAAGIRAARGRIVALTVAEMRVTPEWAHRLIAAIDGDDIVGAGGGFALGRTASMGMRAMFYLRYHAFLAPRDERTLHVAGDNAAYRRDALMAYADGMTDGFWEVDFHRRIAAEGQALRSVADAPVLVEGTLRVREAAAQRYRHGRHSGAWRVETGVRRPWQVVAGAPLVPFLLSLRIARSVAQAKRGFGRFAVALPAILVLASAWALGELRGALAAPRAMALTEAAA